MAALETFEAWTVHWDVERPVAVSEFASTDEPAALMQTVRGMLASGRLHMAAWFSAYWADWPEPSLLTASGELTEIGKLFAAEQHTVYLPAVMA